MMIDNKEISSYLRGLGMGLFFVGKRIGMVIKGRLKIIFVGLYIIGLGMNCFCLPEVEEVVSGEAKIGYPDINTMKIEASHKAIINYKSFDIKENETVIIDLPSSKAEVLNRVLGDKASEIMGKLGSNGIFILVNKNGIYFGPKSEVDVAGLIASTRDITNVDFINSKYIFGKLNEEQLDRLIKNSGKIRIKKGGFGVFIGGAIENEGLIACPVGTVALAGGDKVKIGMDSEGILSVVIDKATASKVLDYEGRPVIDQITNKGRIEADGGVVIMKAEALPGLFRYAINTEGIIKANRVEKKDGVVRLVSSGAIKSEGEINATKVIIGEPKEAIPNEIKIDNGELIDSQLLRVCGKRIDISNSVAPVVEVYRPAEIVLTSCEVEGEVVTLKGEDIKVSYLKSNAVSLETDEKIKVEPGVVIQANQVKLVSEQIGEIEEPIVIEAKLVAIERIRGDIEIMESRGLGSSILVRGPPEGFGAIIYNQEAEGLTLEALRGSIILSKGVSLSANNLTLIASEDIYSEGSIFVSSNLTLLAKGRIVSRGSLSAHTLIEQGETFVISGTTIVGYAYLSNLDNAVDISGDISGTYSDTVNINFTGNVNLIGDTTLRADSDGNQTGRITVSYTHLTLPTIYSV